MALIGQETDVNKRDHGTKPAAAYWLLAVLTALYLVSMIDRQVIGMLIPAIKADLQITDVQMSVLTGAAFGLFYCFAGLPIGYLVDRYSRRVIIFFGVIVWGLATIGCGIAGSYQHLIIARFLVGTGEAALSPAAYSLMGDTFAKHKLGRAMAIFGIGSTFGTALAYGLGGHLLDALPAQGVSSPFGLLAPWQATFVIVALPALICAPLVFTFREPRRTRKEGVAMHPAAALHFIRSRLSFFLRLFLGYGLLLTCAYSFSVWGATALVRRFDVSMSQLSVAFAISAAIGVPTGALLVGWLSDRFVAKGVQDAQMRIFAVVALGQIGFGLLLAMAHTYELAIVAVFGMFVSSGFPSLAAAIPLTTPPHLRGQVSAIYLMVGNLLGTAIGPLIPALLTDKLFKDPALTTWSLAITMFVAGSAAVLLFLTGREPMRRAVLAAEDNMAA
ncbi:MULTISPECIES: MFS transporter [unclassified Sphingobium]|uniref:MFS transporter n=1 Tax=unclassified Sphingobium TaxID=2611147 RepID=UPI0018C9039C|nr:MULTISPECIES: MFS transporter [unclassified Sphingobium]